MCLFLTVTETSEAFGACWKVILGAPGVPRETVSVHLTAHPETEALIFSGDSSYHSHSPDAEWFTEFHGLLLDLLG